MTLAWYKLIYGVKLSSVILAKDEHKFDNPTSESLPANDVSVYSCKQYVIN